MTPSKRIDQLIAKLDDWRGETLAGVRKAMLAADRNVFEEWKWMGSPVWSCDGIIAVGNAHKEKVKVTFAQGAKLADPDSLFNAGLEGNRWRAIDFFEGDKINAAALKKLVRAAVEFNRAAKAKKTASRVAAGIRKKSTGVRSTSKK